MKCHIRNTLDHFTSFPLSGVVSPCPGSAVLATGSWASPTWPLQGGGQSGVFCSGCEFVESLVAAPGDLEESRSFSEAQRAPLETGKTVVRSHGAETASRGSEIDEDSYSHRTVIGKGSTAPSGRGICPRGARSQACSFTCIYWGK